ncbi:MAG: ArsR family transcriptional regulator [Prevotellaceae bacterium]|jgi:hypothetical protein|nr:ArsR family transcriptional regulator [Prevotellaceae bacterium]
MEKTKLQQRLEELVEAITNLNSSRHNPSDELEDYARDLFDEIIDEIKN